MTTRDEGLITCRLHVIEGILCQVYFVIEDRGWMNSSDYETILNS